VQVTVVGAGVIGLTTALVLEERGHHVRIVAAEAANDTVSSVAGAVWFPYRAGPPARVAAWAAITRDWLDGLIAEPAAGVDQLTGYEIATEDGHDLPRPWWAGVEPVPGSEPEGSRPNGLAVSRAPAPVIGAPIAWRFRAPRVEPALFLPWITARLRARIEHRPVVDLAAEPGDAVVNCTGLAARELAGDDHIFPLFGQIVVAERGTVDPAITVTDDRDPDAIFYVIPRRGELVLGGCSLPWPPGAPPEVDPAITERILAQARALGVAHGAVRTVRAGLRPYRSEVRLERDPHARRVIHNYGHGGAGYTLCRGCALDVARLLSE